MKKLQNLLAIVAVVFLTASFFSISTPAFAGQSGLSPAENKKVVYILSKKIVQTDVSVSGNGQEYNWSFPGRTVPPVSIPYGQYEVRISAVIDQGDGVWSRALYDCKSVYINGGNVPMILDLDESFCFRFTIKNLPPELSQGTKLSIRLLSSQQDWLWNEVIRKDGFKFSYYTFWSDTEKPLHVELYYEGRLFSKFDLPNGFNAVSAAKGIVFDWDELHQSPPPANNGVTINIPIN